MIFRVYFKNNLPSHLVLHRKDFPMIFRKFIRNIQLTPLNQSYLEFLLLLITFQDSIIS